MTVEQQFNPALAIVSTDSSNCLYIQNDNEMRTKNTKKDFDEYVRTILSGSEETVGFFERFSEPSELHATVGMIAIKFAELEEKLSDTIGLMLQLDKDRSDIVTAEQSFNLKLNLFSSLYHHLKKDYFFNTFSDFEDEYMRALLNALRKGSDMRNRR